MKILIVATIVLSLVLAIGAATAYVHTDATNSLIRQYGTIHSPGIYWQMTNEHKAEACRGIPACLIAQGVAI